MITIPLKETESTEWADHINPALIDVYGSASEFTNEIDAIDRMREAVASVTPTTQLRDVLYRYFAQIDLLALHLPMNPCKTEFKWKNAYDSKSTAQKSVAFEKACVLFNLGATLSHIGSDSEASKDYKSAYHSFCCASGVFKFAGENFLHAACVDVEPQTFAALTKLMLAEAQHCFFLKAKQSSTAPGLLAKLAQSACSLYLESSELIQVLYNEHWWCFHKLIDDIVETAGELKLDAHIFQAQHLEKQHKVGDAIAHVKEARRDCTDRKRSDEMKAQIKSLEKDNDMIYHEKVPDSAPEIPETQAAKPLALDALYPTMEQASKVVGKDLFERIIHISVHEKASLYSEMKAQFLRDQIEKAEVAKLELTSALEYMDLPASISRLRQSGKDVVEELPADIFEYSLTVASSLNPYTKCGIRTDFMSQRNRIKSLLQLQTSSAIDTSLRTKQGLLNVAKVEAELQNICSKLDDGALQVLSNPKKLDAWYHKEAFSAASSASTASNISLLDLDDTKSDAKGLDVRLDVVSDLVAKLQKIMKERNASLAQLRDKVHSDDIIQKIVAHQDNLDDVEKTLLEPELEKFQPIVRRIDATVRLQKAVLSDTIEKWKGVLESKEAKAVLAEREAIGEASARICDALRDTFHQWNTAMELSQRVQSTYASLEREALNLGTSGSSNMGPNSGPPPPPKPPKQNDSDLNGYKTPSAYIPSMYH